MDPKQVLSAFLTLSMFAMLANMIKKEHFDSAEVSITETNMQYNAVKKLAEQSLVSLQGVKGLWPENELVLEPCWGRSKPKVEQSKGFVTFSLTNGPEYHVSQIADAVVVARHLGATLVVPDIRGSNPGEMRNFQEIYDVEKFVRSLSGVVKVIKDQPSELSEGKLAVMRVPNRVTEDHITERIEPIFRKKGNLRVATFFPSINMRKTDAKKDVDSVACMAMYGSLQLQPEVHEVVDSMVERLRTLSPKSNRQFLAVDLRVEMLEKKGCQGSGGSGRQSCYNAQEIAKFLRNIGYDTETTIYVTQSWWHSSLDALKEIFPKTYTKETIMPADEKSKFLSSGTPDYEKVIDFHICSQSDVFVPAISGLFYANVAGKRIASGRTKIFVPSQVTNSSTLDDFISPYVSKKNHMAFSCFCEKLPTNKT